MRQSQIIEIAARTARLLGYKIILLERAYDWPQTDKTELMYYVIDPTGVMVCKSYLQLSLGHILVRLHMEKHYGIPTEHYWEEKK